MATPPWVVFKATFPDMSPHAALGTILRWCDIAQVSVFDSIPDAAVCEDLKRFWARGAVQRKNTVEMLVTGEEWGNAVNVDTSGQVLPTISRVGRTSWVVDFSVQTAEGVALARVSTVMVAVDAADSSRPVPVPHADALRAILAEAPAVEAPSACPRPVGAYVWQTQVRQSDCDGFQHMNNAFYADLVEDARCSAGRAGALGGAAASGGSARMASIDYLGQPRALEFLDVAAWWDGGAGTLGFEFTAAGSGDVVATATLVPWAAARSSM